MQSLSRTTILPPDLTSMSGIHLEDQELIHSKLVTHLQRTNLARKQSNTDHSVRTKTAIIKTPATIKEELEIFEEKETCHLVWNRHNSVDKATMTDLQWSDPRLVKKYAKTKLPYSKSLSTPMNQKTKIQYHQKLNEIADKKEAKGLCAMSKIYIWRWLYYFCTCSMCFVGSCCGLFLATYLIWRLVEDYIFTKEKPPTDLDFREYLGLVLRSVEHFAKSMIMKFCTALNLPATGVYPEEEDTEWYRNFFGKLFSKFW